MRSKFLSLALLVVPAFVLGADPKPQFEPRLAQTGTLVWQDNMKDGPSKDWKIAKGKWTANEGATRVVELKEDMHGAVARRSMNGKDFVVQFSFKLDQSKAMSLSINGEKGHLCRVFIRPNAFIVQKDDTDGKNGPDKNEVLQTQKVEIKPGKWHTVLLEMRGMEMLANLDGKHIAFGEHKAIQATKVNLGLTCAGDGGWLKDVIVWTAEPNNKWPETKAKLLKDAPMKK